MVERTTPTTNPRTSGGAAIVGTEHGDGPGPEVMDANTLIGDSVVNDSGENLGKIEAIMLDVSAGKIAYAVLSFGGFLGMGNKLFAIPWSAFTLDTDQECLRPQRRQGPPRRRAGLRQGPLAGDGGPHLGVRASYVLQHTALLGRRLHDDARRAFDRGSRHRLSSA